MSDYRTCRIDADIVIIDSGLDKTLQLNENIIGGVRICVDDEENAVISENFDDLFGHGTAIYSIINNNCDAMMSLTGRMFCFRSHLKNISTYCHA